MKKLDGAASESNATSTKLAATSDEFKKWLKKLKAKFQNSKVNKIAHAAIKNLR